MRRSELKRTTPLKKGRGFAASPAQRKKVKQTGCIVCGGEPAHDLCGPVDAAHVWPRSRGGCEHEDCVVGLCRGDHYLYDLHGGLDLLPYLIAHGCTRELQHALEHASGDLIGLLEHITGVRWQPVDEREAA